MFTTFPLVGFIHFIQPFGIKVHHSISDKSIQQENYLGEYQKVTDFTDNPTKQRDVEQSYIHVDKPDADEREFDARKYR